MENIHKYRKNITNFILRKPAIPFATILLNYHCTQRCLQCNIPQKATETNFLRFDQFRQITEKLESHGTHGIVLSGGEPVLNPDFEKIADYLGSRPLRYRHILTTLYYSKEIMQKITPILLRNRINLTCSFDGFDETADKLRGATNVSDIVSENIEYLTKQNTIAGNPLKTIINIVVSNLNIDQIERIIKYAEYNGWKFNLDIYRNSSTHHNEIDDMFIRDLRKLQSIFENAKLSSKLVTPHWLLDGYADYFEGSFQKICPYVHSPSFGSKFYIQPDGEILVCIGDSIGNIIKEDWDQIFKSCKWESRKREFRHCNGCWNSCYTSPGRLKIYIQPSFLNSAFKSIKNLK